MWNASHVHKQSIKVWQEKMVDPTWNSVWGMLSTSLLWGRFWCSRTIQIVSKVLPDCDISAVKRKFKWTTWRFLGLASSHFWKNWQVRHGDQPWYHKHWIGVFVGTWPIHAPGAPCKHSSKSSRHKTKPSTKQRKFYICADGPHTHSLEIEKWIPSGSGIQSDCGRPPVLGQTLCARLKLTFSGARDRSARSGSAIFSFQFPLLLTETLNRTSSNFMSFVPAWLSDLLINHLDQ